MFKCPYCLQKYPTMDEVDDHVLAGHRDEPINNDNE